MSETRQKERKSQENSGKFAESREKALLLLEELKEEAARGKPVLVEGKNDAKALKELGVVGNIVNLKGNKSLSEIAERISSELTELAKKNRSEKSAIILTDPDSEGGKIAARIAYLLEQYGIHPELKFRKICRLLGKGAVEQCSSMR